jgi:xanthosine utilization system XapX-like protein
MDPWIIAVIVLASILLIREASLYFKGPATGVSSEFGVVLASLLSRFIYYIPVALVSFGFIADIISQSFKFSIGGLVAISALILNGLIGMLLGTRSVAEVAKAVAAAPAAVVSNVANAVSEGNPFSAAAPAPAPALAPDGVPTTNPFRGGGRELCAFPGLENFDNKYAPQNILVTTAVMFYYMIGEWESGNASRTISPGVALLLTVVSQIGVRYSSGCLDPWWAPLVSIVGGAGIGIGGYHIAKAINGGKTPFIANQTGTPTSGGLSGTEAPVTDAAKPADGSKCAEANGDDFVCDLYKNGELITTTVSS